MRYLKYLKHWIVIHPVRTLILLLFLILFFSILFYFRKEIKSKLSNYKLEFKLNRKLKYSIILIALLSALIVSFFYFKNNRSNRIFSENTNISKTNHLFGIDISHHNGEINWDELKKSKHPIKYVFIKATEGKKLVDKRFHYNWKNAKGNGYLVGAYHFYSTNVSSEIQFNHFSSTVELEKGDLLPVLDVEKESSFGKKNLVKGIRNWINLCEIKYGVKPIIYTGRKFYEQFLKDEFSDCPLWIASYSHEKSIYGIEWHLHQFTEKVIVKGVPEKVDGNNFKGDFVKLKNDYCIK
jgi:GH25 family lysozyme M1 (1,4-beta-N-acetylmuramidase)